ncbi:hypothetical protein IIZ81_01135 [Candidatus Saccharibacteria bacterium]|nr:hypothetical protein [Candidatus Saccharibacteria bacterium]
MLKVYLNSEPKIVGVKFDDYKYTQVRVSAIGDVESGATVFFVPYDRDVHGDFNSDPMYKKDYDYDFNQIFKTMLAIREDDASFSFKQIPSLAGLIARVVKEEDGTVKGAQALGERLMTMLSYFGDTKN